MNKLNVILEELNEHEAENFIASCVAKQKNLFGIPRFIIKKNTRLKLSKVKNFLTKDEFYFVEIDKKYFDIIEDKFLDSFLEDIEYEIVFDLCRLCFDKNDDFFDYLPNKFKKLFNLNLRSIERKNFLKSNAAHLDDMSCITTKVICHKLNQVWKYKWSKSSSYLNEYDDNIVNNIISA